MAGLVLLAGLLGLMIFSGPGTDAETPDGPRIFINLLSGDPPEQKAALDSLSKNWSAAHVPKLVEVARFSDSRTRAEVLRLLRDKTGQTIKDELNAWLHWTWNEAPAYEIEDYAAFKAALYAGIDRRFARYFAQAQESKPRIRLDEIAWGGVLQDGIPPLREPEMISAKEAGYLADDNLVFGLVVNGDARAYPKRILAWHEMFTDTIGGVPVAGVYCTLCGSMILYETSVGGTQHVMGTSGFLYRSNKLMYDRATQSLWSTLEGEPVVGPLVGKDIRLPRRSVVTTTWREWRKQHPETKVLSLRTGHRRDYAEGAAYHDYFGTDELMFTVPKLDRRLKNKDEVLALAFPEAGRDKLAIAAAFLRTNPVYHGKLDGRRFVVLTDGAGANRVYESPEAVRFVSWDQTAAAAKDADGRDWRVTEDELLAPDARKLKRLPAHRAFWFGWHAAFPDTQLVK